MKKKISALAEKTGLKRSESSVLAKTGFFGLIALAIFGIAGCKDTKKDALLPASSGTDAKPQAQAVQPAATDAAAIQPSTTTAKVEIPQTTSTGTFKPAPFAKPWDNYPAGAKYNTVSPLDFLA